MRTHSPAFQPRRQLVYDRLYRNGMQLYEKKAKLIQKNQNQAEDPECTFRPNLEKKADRLRRLIQPSGGNKQNSRTPIKHSNNCGAPSPRSRFAIQKEISNIEIRGMENNYLKEAREAAAKRSRDFNERFHLLKLKMLADIQTSTPRDRRAEELLRRQADTVGTNSSAYVITPRSSRTPTVKASQNLEILVQESSDIKSTKPSSTKRRSTKFFKKKPQLPEVDDDLTTSLQECIEKAMMLSRTLDEQMSLRRK